MISSGALSLTSLSPRVRPHMLVAQLVFILAWYNMSDEIDLGSPSSPLNGSESSRARHGASPEGEDFIFTGELTERLEAPHADKLRQADTTADGRGSPTIGRRLLANERTPTRRTSIYTRSRAPRLLVLARALRTASCSASTCSPVMNTRTGRRRGSQTRSYR